MSIQILSLSNTKYWKERIKINKKYSVPEKRFPLFKHKNSSHP